MQLIKHLLSVALFLAFANQAAGQGIIIDRRVHIPISRSYQVKEVIIDATVRDQVASVQVTQTFLNLGKTQLEVEYYFPIPQDGALQNFTLMVDGKELKARLLDKEEARRIYESIVRQRQDPALLEYVGRGLLKTSIFPIPPGKTRKVTLNYTQLCKRDHNIVRFDYPLATHKHADKSIEKLNIHLKIYSAEPIKSIYSSTHSPKIKHRNDNEAVVELEKTNVKPGSDFQLLYTIAKQSVGATVLSYRPSDKQDGYFMLLASPGFTKPDKKPQPKTILFVLDKSGSMSGKKIIQARNALSFVLRNLNEGDTFNIITYNDSVDSYKPELQLLNRKSRRDALGYVDNIRAGGSTNIDLALSTAIKMVPDTDKPAYVLFLTDGLPTAGEQNEMEIAANFKKANKHKARLIAFGVGYDVNARLLDRLSGNNGGVSEYVKPDADIEAAVARFYGRITAPVLSDIQIDFTKTKVNRIYPSPAPDLFEGGQLVIVGRYHDSGKAKIKLTGKVGKDKQTYHYKTTLASGNNGSAYQFIEKLWAQRRIGHLIDKIDLEGENEELTAELIELSKKYGILTPYTAFLAEEGVNLNDARYNDRATTYNLSRLKSDTSGSAGVGQRAAKSMYRSGSVANQKQAAEAVDYEGNVRVITSVMNINNRSFFRKKDHWIQSDLTDKQLKNAIEIKQFSDEYFKLSRQVGTDNQYMIFKEEVTVEMQGKIYNIKK